MGAARSGVDRLPERSRAVAWRSQAGGARGRGIRRGGARRRQGREGAAGRRPRRRSRERAQARAVRRESIVEPFGDIWLRDTGPIVIGCGGRRHAQGFAFNGWGGKYDLDGRPGHRRTAGRRAGLPRAHADWILEGGAIDGDGSGTRRHDRAMPAQPEPQHALARARSNSAWRTTWVRTRRVARHRACSTTIPTGMSTISRASLRRVDSRSRHRRADDPNAASIAMPRSRLGERAGHRHPALARPRGDEDGDDHPGELHELLHRQCGGGGSALWGAERPAPPSRRSRRCFPDRKAVGLRADHVLTGGGSFHCISQQVPL